MNPKVYWSCSQDPYLNAAHEEWLYTHVAPQEALYFLWQNTDSVCLGRYQNPWSELNMTAIANDHLPVVRRISGGGTVFHDLGNLNISYMHPGSEYDKKSRMLPIMNHLKSTNDITISERGDGLISHDGQKYKFSGSAYKNRHTSSLHHFTLLLHSDLTRLWKFIKKDKSSLFEGRSQPSTRAEVCNLNIPLAKEWAHDWATQHGFKWIEIEPDHLNTTFVEKFSSVDWNFGETPEFRFKSQNNDHFLLIQKGKFVGENETIFAKELDCHPVSIDALQSLIQGHYDFSKLF